MMFLIWNLLRQLLLADMLFVLWVIVNCHGTFSGTLRRQLGRCIETSWLKIALQDGYTVIRRSVCSHCSRRSVYATRVLVVKVNNYTLFNWIGFSLCLHLTRFHPVTGSSGRFLPARFHIDWNKWQLTLEIDGFFHLTIDSGWAYPVLD
jgi:hypothetical protein